MNPILVLLILFLVTLFLGVPFAWSLSFSCICTLCFMSGFPLMTAVQKMYNGGAKYTLLAIFFFMLAGAIMQHGGISSRLVDFSKALLGHVRGGLSIVVLAVCMMFAALSGSSIATTAAIGGMLYPELVKEKYPEGYSAALPGLIDKKSDLVPSDAGYHFRRYLFRLVYANRVCRGSGRIWVVCCGLHSSRNDT